MARSIGHPPVEKKRILVVDAFSHASPRPYHFPQRLGKPDCLWRGRQYPERFDKDRGKIAHALNLSLKTIETHRENIKHKLGLDSGEALVERATKYVEDTLEREVGETISVVGKKKPVRLPSAS